MHCALKQNNWELSEDSIFLRYNCFQFAARSKVQMKTQMIDCYHMTCNFPVPQKRSSKNCRTSLSKMSFLFCHFRPGSPWNKRPIQTGSKQDLYTLTLSRPFASGWIMYQFVHIRGASCRCTQSKNEHNKSKHFYSKPISTLWKIAFRMSACNNYIALLQLTIYLKCCLLIQFLIIQHTYYI